MWRRKKSGVSCASACCSRLYTASPTPRRSPSRSDKLRSRIASSFRTCTRHHALRTRTPRNEREGNSTKAVYPAASSSSENEREGYLQNSSTSNETLVFLYNFHQS